MTPLLSLLDVSPYLEPLTSLTCWLGWVFMLGMVIAALNHWRHYQARGERGVALQVGRACFKYGLREFGSGLGLTELAFRLLPLSTKIRVGSTSFANLFNRASDQRVRLEHPPGQMLWHIERCPLCWERQADEPICHMAVGLLQESLYWISGGKIFDVEETDCMARGDAACTIVIDQTPLD